MFHWCALAPHRKGAVFVSDVSTQLNVDTHANQLFWSDHVDAPRLAFHIAAFIPNYYTGATLAEAMAPETNAEKPIPHYKYVVNSVSATGQIRVDLLFF